MVHPVTGSAAAGGAPHGSTPLPRDAIPFEHVVVPLAAGEAPDAVLDVVAALCRRSPVPVRVVSVAPGGSHGDELENHLRELAARGPGVDRVELRIVDYGSISAAVADAARPGGLVCMSSHGVERAHAFVHSVTDDLLRRASDPVLLVGPHVASGTRLEGRVVACHDGSPFADRACEVARRWAEHLALPFWLAQVVESGAPVRVRALAERLGDVDGVEVIERGEPASALTGLAMCEPVALLVMATHGRSGWSRALVGSVTAATVRRSPVPVLVVPAPGPGDRPEGAGGHLAPGTAP
ncbi:MAG TPA: universal stress protein [Acidimicrobiales bacterium]